MQHVYTLVKKKPTRCNINGLLINPNYIDMFRSKFCPSSGALVCVIQLVVCCTQCVAYRQRIGYNIPQAVLHRLMLLKMGKI